MPTFASVKDRAALKPRRDPYWSRVSKGCYLGYRKMTSDTVGAWTARYLDGLTGKQQRKTLGGFSELPDHKRYDAAKKEAQEWFDHLTKGGSAEVFTVADACAKYVGHLRDEKKGARTIDETQARFDSFILADKRFAKIELAKLTPAHIETWRKTLRDRPATSGPNRGEKRSDSSLNRDMTGFRAALNLAFRDGHVTSDFAWRSKLLPIKNADKRREIYLDLEQRRKLIAYADGDIANFLRGMQVLPLRPGALAALTASNYDKRFNTLTIGKDKHGKDRKMPLPDATAAFFAELTKGKIGAAPLLAKADGKVWDKDSWKGPVKAAVRAAGLPDAVSAYTMRHSAITDLVHAGTDTLTVAQLAGTSVLMIEKHYGHLTKEHAREALARLAF